MHEDFQVHVDSDWVGDLLERKNTTRHAKTRPRFETNCETNEYFHLFINTEMLMIAARIPVDYVECTSMVFHSSAKVVENALESMKLNGAECGGTTS